MAGFIEGLKDEYESLILKLEESGVPSPRVVLPLAIIIILAAVGFWAFQNFGQQTVSVELLVKSSDGTPVANAVVKLFKDGEYFETQTSAGDGKVSFAKVPEGASLSATVSAQGFLDLTQAVSSTGGQLFLQKAQSTPSSKTVVVKVMDADGNDVSGAQVTLSFSDANVREGFTSSDGTVSIVVPASWLAPVSAKVEKSGFISGLKSSLDLSEVIIVELTLVGDSVSPEDQKGSFVVSVESRGQAVDGAVVSLIDYLTEDELRSGRTDSTGNVLLSNIQFGKTFFVSVKADSQRFKAFLSDDAIEFGEDTSRFEVELQNVETADDVLSVLVQNSKTKAPLAGAEVTVFSKTSRVSITSEFTGSDGIAKIALDKGKQYYVTAYKFGFLPAFSENVGVGGTAKTMELTEENEGNSVEANVTVRENGDSVPGARVEIFRANGFPLGVPPQTTGVDGTASFVLPLQVGGGSYNVFASASTDDNKRGVSDIVQVQEGIALFVSVQAERARLTVFVKDLVTNKSVQNAVVAIEAQGERVLECTTTNATCYFEVAPENEFLISASSAGYIKTKSSSYNLLPAQKETATVFLYPTSFSSQAAVNFIGLFDSSGTQVSEAEPAQEYTARFLAKTPAGAKRTSLFVSVGGKSTASEDNSFISDFDAGFAPNVYSGESSETICFPSSNTSSKDEWKWVQFDFPTGLSGSRELALKVKTRASAKAGEKLVFEYRMNGDRENTPFIHPYDEGFLDSLLAKLNNGQTLSQEDYCEAPTGKKELAFSKNPLSCENGLCQRIRLESDGAIQKNGLTVGLGKEFKINFELQAYEGQNIESIALEKNDAFEIISFSQSTASESMGGANELQFASQTLPLNAQSGERVSGSFTMRALSASSFVPLALTIKFDNADDIVISRFVQIEGTNAFSVSSSPQDLLVGETTLVKIIVLDSLGNPVKDAVVAIFEAEGSPLAGQEIDLVGDGSSMGVAGKYPARLQPSSLGSIGLRVSKDGFATFEDERAFTISAAQFLTVAPESIEFTGYSTQQSAKQVIVSSLLPLTLEVASTSDCPTGSVSVSPVAFNLQGENPQVVSVSVKSGLTLLDKDCFITFNAKASQSAQAQARVSVFINVQSPPVEPTSCDSVTFGSGQKAECLEEENAQERSCTLYTGAVCSVSGQSCFSCTVGESTLPSKISLAVSNNKQFDTQSYAIALDKDPLECRLEWITQFDVEVPVYSYASANSLEFQSSAYNYYGYQPNSAYNQQNLWQNPQQYSMQNYYPQTPYYTNDYYGSSNYGTGYTNDYYGSTGASNWQSQLPQNYQQYYGSFPQVYPDQSSQYGSGYSYYNPTYGSVAGGTPYPQNAQMLPPYCYQYLSMGVNQQSLYGNYYSNYNQNPWSSSPTGLPPQCQYPLVCEKLQFCSYYYNSGSGSQSGFGFNYVSDITSLCSKTTSTTTTSTSTTTTTTPTLKTTYRQAAYPVSINLETCTRDEIQISAQYTGEDYFNNGGLGGSQAGLLRIKTKAGTFVSVPIEVSVAGVTVPVVTPSPPVVYVTPTPLPTQTPTPTPTQTPYPYYQQYNNQLMPQYIPPECYQTVSPYAQTGTQQQQWFTDLPSEITLKVNHYTHKGYFELTSKKLPSGGFPCSTLKVEAKGVKIKSCSSSKLVLEASFSRTKVLEELPSGTLTMQWIGVQSSSSGPLSHEIPISVEADEFNPQLIQLYHGTLGTPVVPPDFVGPPAPSPSPTPAADTAVFETDSSVESKNCKKSGTGFSVSCKDGVLTATSSSTGSGTLTVSGLDDEQGVIREIPVQVSGPVGSISIDVATEKTKTINFNFGTYTPECIDIRSDSSLSGAPEVTCVNNVIKITAKYSTDPNVLKTLPKQETGYFILGPPSATRNEDVKNKIKVEFNNQQSTATPTPTTPETPSGNGGGTSLPGTTGGVGGTTPSVNCSDGKTTVTLKSGESACKCDLAKVNDDYLSSYSVYLKLFSTSGLQTISAGSTEYEGLMRVVKDAYGLCLDTNKCPSAGVIIPWKNGKNAIGCGYSGSAMCCFAPSLYTLVATTKPSVSKPTTTIKPTSSALPNIYGAQEILVFDEKEQLNILFDKWYVFANNLESAHLWAIKINRDGNVEIKRSAVKWTGLTEDDLFTGKLAFDSVFTFEESCKWYPTFKWYMCSGPSALKVLIIKIKDISNGISAIVDLGA